MARTTITALIIDDSAAMRQLLQLLLDNSYFINYAIRVVTAKDLASATELLLQSKFDVVVMDLTLPDSQGIDTFRAIKAITKDIPIIIVSGLDDPELMFQTMADGATDYIVKGSMDSRGLAYRIIIAVSRDKASKKTV